MTIQPLLLITPPLATQCVRYTPSDQQNKKDNYSVRTVSIYANPSCKYQHTTQLCTYMDPVSPPPKIIIILFHTFLGRHHSVVQARLQERFPSSDDLSFLLGLILSCKQFLFLIALSNHLNGFKNTQHGLPPSTLPPCTHWFHKNFIVRFHFERFICFFINPYQQFLHYPIHQNQ